MSGEKLKYQYPPTSLLSLTFWKIRLTLLRRSTWCMAQKYGVLGQGQALAQDAAEHFVGVLVGRDVMPESTPTHRRLASLHWFSCGEKIVGVVIGHGGQWR